MLAFRAASRFLKRQQTPPMLELFHKGGPIMWPLVVLSIIALTVVLERLIFIARERARRNAGDVDAMLTQIERGDLDTAANLGISSRDFVARALAYALTHRLAEGPFAMRMRSRIAIGPSARRCCARQTGS
jgi:biopolymer transport protein ExbB/TolQ